MLTKIKLKVAVGLGIIALPLVTFAADPAPDAKEMSKDAWLAQIKQLVPNLVCKSFVSDDSINTQLKAHNIDYDKCVALIPALEEKCQTKYYDSLPATINQETAAKWGRTIGECIGGNFVVNHLYGESAPAASGGTTPPGATTTEDTSSSPSTEAPPTTTTAPSSTPTTTKP